MRTVSSHPPRTRRFCQPKFNDHIEAVSDTIRTEATNVHAERPHWLPSWVKLIAIIRRSLYPVFWEMFAGKAGLTREFLSQGWPCGPPVDIVHKPDYDLFTRFSLRSY